MMEVKKTFLKGSLKYRLSSALRCFEPELQYFLIQSFPQLPNAATGINKASKITFFMQRDRLKKKVNFDSFNVIVNLNNNLNYSKKKCKLLLSEQPEWLAEQ